MKKIEVSQKSVQFMAGWHRADCLWSKAEGSPFENPPYESKESARWALRTMRKQLVDAKALAKPAKLLMVHPERFAKALEAFAVARACDGIQMAPVRNTRQIEIPL